MTDQQRKLAERMALEVLKGDDAAALALADLLSENVTQRAIPPITKLTCDKGLLRVVLRTYETLGGDVQVDQQYTMEAVHCWLEYGEPLMLMGMTVELYELPAGYKVKEPPLIHGYPIADLHSLGVSGVQGLNGIGPDLPRSADELRQRIEQYQNGLERYIAPQMQMQVRHEPVAGFSGGSYIQAPDGAWYINHRDYLMRVLGYSSEAADRVLELASQIRDEDREERRRFNLEAGLSDSEK